MKFILVLVLLIQLISCKEKSEKVDNVVTETKTNIFRNKPTNVLTSKTKIKDTLTIPIPLKPKIPEIINEPIKCFNPNLRISDAINVINSGIGDTQWFVAERKKINYQHIKLDLSDTIWIKKELLKLEWQLIDSLQTDIGNQNKITLKMQKGNRICNIEKKLYLSNKKTYNEIEEWFEITEIK